jgi:hypothetical protein
MATGGLYSVFSRFGSDAARRLFPSLADSTQQDPGHRNRSLKRRPLCRSACRTRPIGRRTQSFQSNFN